MKILTMLSNTVLTMKQNRDIYPSQEELHRLFNYNPETGILTWRVARSSNVRVGQEAGTLRLDGYRQVSINGNLCKVHRVIWIFVTGFNPGHDIDHRKGIRDDNRFKELREVTPTCNNQNRTISSNNTSGYTGVSLHKSRGKYIAQIRINGKTIHIGTFKTPLEAARARLDYEDASPDWHCDLRNVSRLQVGADEEKLQQSLDIFKTANVTDDDLASMFGTTPAHVIRLRATC